MTDSVSNLRYLKKEGYEASTLLIDAYDSVVSFPDKTAWSVFVETHKGGRNTACFDMTNEEAKELTELLVSNPQVAWVEIRKMGAENV